MVNYQMVLPLCQWNEDEKPLNKMMLKGRQSLTNSELMSFFIQETNQNNTVELARMVLNDAQDNLNELSVKTLKELCQVKGVGMSAASRIMAAMELGRRDVMVGDSIYNHNSFSGNTGFKTVSSVHTNSENVTRIEFTNGECYNDWKNAVVLKQFTTIS